MAKATNPSCSDKRVNVFASVIEDENKVDIQRRYPRGGKALKAFYYHYHRPSAPAVFDFIHQRLEDDILFQSSQSVLDDLSEESSSEDANSESSFSFAENKEEEEEEEDMTPVKKTNLPSILPDMETNNTNLWTFHYHEVNGKTHMEEMKNSLERRYRLGSRSSGHSVGYGARRALRSIDWTHGLPRLVRKGKDKTTNTTTTTTNAPLPTNKIKNSISSLSTCTIPERIEHGKLGTHGTKYTERTHSEVPANLTTTKTDSILSNTFRIDKSMELDREHCSGALIDSEFLETTDDEDNIYHRAPYSLGCLASSAFFPESPTTLLTSGTSTIVHYRHPVNRKRVLDGTNQSPRTPNAPLEMGSTRHPRLRDESLSNGDPRFKKEGKQKYPSKWLFLRFIANMFCNSHHVKHD